MATGARDTAPQNIVSAVASDLPTDAAVRHIHSRLPPDGLAALIVFFSPQHDPETMARDLQALYRDVPVYGCTTSGELSPRGLRDHSIVAMGFPASHFSIHARVLTQLSTFEVERGREAILELRRDLVRAVPGASNSSIFGLLLIDGLCRREEAVISALYAALDDIPMVGGSAGDDLKFRRTHVICNGIAHTDAAIVILTHTDLPFRVFKCDHFEPTGVKMVVTEADNENRLVKELNAEPAAAEYARTVGITDTKLDPFCFAAHPVVVRVGGEYYARSIQRVNEDGSLGFFCAIDEGLVLSAARPRDMLESLKSAFREIEADIGAPDLYLGFDCVLRRLDAEQRQITQDLSELYRAHRVIGFNSYGEQYRSMHLNQTFTGVAIGRRARTEVS